MRRFVIDTDTASDDALALLMALRHRDVEVLAITVVAGNVPLAQAVQNALYTVERAGGPAPVYAGCLRPLIEPQRTAEHVHGRDGMGDIGLQLSGRTPASGHAVDVLVEIVRRHEPQTLTLVTLGPLTNVATAFARAPDLPARLREVVIMGGTADAVGNVSAVGEFNVWADPEAAAIVFGSEARLTMVGWDISRRYATFDAEQAQELRALGPLGEFAVDIQAVLDTHALAETQLPGFDLPDPIAMAVALDPATATLVRELNVVVETRGAFTRGQTVVDHLRRSGRVPNVRVVLEASRERFVSLLRDALRPDGSRDA